MPPMLAVKIKKEVVLKLLEISNEQFFKQAFEGKPFVCPVTKVRIHSRGFAWFLVESNNESDINQFLNRIDEAKQ